MKTQIEQLMSDPDFRKAFALEKAILDAAELIATLMHEKQMSKADLARLLGKSRAWVTQLLSGKENLTVRTLAEVLYALNFELDLRMRTLEAGTRKAAPREVFSIERGHWPEAENSGGVFEGWSNPQVYGDASNLGSTQQFEYVA